MSFIWPLMLVSLVLVPLLVALYLRIQRRQRQIVARYGSLGFAQVSATRRIGRRRSIPPALFLIGLAILLFALARPQTEISLPRREGTVMLLFDVSGSMAAEDMQPTRMEAAKTAARTFVERQPSSVQIGVVAFSDSGLAIQAPTNDQAAVLAAINRLSPQRGTSLGQGILASLGAIEATKQEAPLQYSNRTPTPAPAPTPLPRGTYTSAVIVLLTDGENNESPNPLAAAQAAIDRGVRVFTVGIGSAAGTILHVNGFTVHTQLDETLLQQIAQLADGAYYNAQNQDQLDTIYNDIDLQFVIKPEKTEVTALFAGVGILLLLLGGVCSMLWFSRVP
jgi:Ca-activated chloride channel family protein